MPSFTVSAPGATQPPPLSTVNSLIWAPAACAYEKPTNPRAPGVPSAFWMVTLSSAVD